MALIEESFLLIMAEHSTCPVATNDSCIRFCNKFILPFYLLRTINVMATTDTITIHSPGLCAQLLNTGSEQLADTPVEKKVKKVHILFAYFASFEEKNICR